MPSFHESLSECLSRSKELVGEIEKFKKSRILHQTATTALESTATALRETLKEVEPLTEKRLREMFHAIETTSKELKDIIATLDNARKVLYIIAVAVMLNVLFCVAILIVL